MDNLNSTHKLKKIALRNSRSTLLAYAFPVCVYSGVAILIGLTTSPYYYFILCYLVTALFISCCIIFIHRVDNYTYSYGSKLVLIQSIYWAFSFPIWLLLLEGARAGGLLFALTMLIFLFSYGSLKIGIILNTFVVSCYITCAYIGIFILNQPGGFKQDALLVTAYLPVSIIIVQVGSKLAKKKRFVKNLLIKQKSTQAELELTLVKLKEAASTDELTGLINRRELNNRLNYELTKTHRDQSNMTLLLLDLDHFKVINDTHGHQCGDQVLKFVANCLRQHFRTTDSIARWGGEEFLILMPSTSIEEAKQVSTRALMALKNGGFTFNNQSIEVTASGGLCELSHKTNLESALQVADKRLYIAKAKGRNQIISTS